MLTREVGNIPNRKIDSPAWWSESGPETPENGRLFSGTHSDFSGFLEWRSSSLELYFEKTLVNYLSTLSDIKISGLEYLC